MLKTFFFIVLILSSFTSAHATPELSNIFRVAAQSNNLSLKFASNVILGSYMPSSNVSNEFAALSAEFNRTIDLNQPLEQWVAKKNLTKAAVTALAKYSIPSIISRRVNVSKANAAYLIKASNKPEVIIPFKSFIGADALTEYVESFPLNKTHSTGSITALRYGHFYGVRSTRERMAEYNRLGVTAEDECNSLINSMLLAAKSKNYEAMLNNYNNIYLSDLKWQAYLDLMRLAVISWNFQLGDLVVGNAPEGGLKSIEQTGNFIEISSWLLAYTAIRNKNEITL